MALKLNMFRLLLDTDYKNIFQHISYACYAEKYCKWKLSSTSPHKATARAKYPSTSTIREVAMAPFNKVRSRHLF